MERRAIGSKGSGSRSNRIGERTNRGDSGITVTRPMPVTARGRRTRGTLIKAARKVFERAGFLDTRLSDITTEAKCSAGTFYTYFDSKEEIATAVFEQAKQSMLHPSKPHVGNRSDPISVIYDSTRAYLESFSDNARLMTVLEQAAHVSSQFRALRHERSMAFFQRNARSIVNLQKKGFVDPKLDPLLTATALSRMVSGLAYLYLADDDLLSGDQKVDLDTLAVVASRLWVNALGLQGTREGNIENVPDAAGGDWLDGD